MLWFGGKLHASGPIAVDANDRGLTLGDGVFDTLVAAKGRAHLRDWHLDRLWAGCTAIGLCPPPRSEIETALSALIAADPSPCVIRITLTRGPGNRGLALPQAPQPTVLLRRTPWQPPDQSAPRHAITSRIHRNPTSPLSRIKSLNALDQVLALREAIDQGADDAIMPAGNTLACGSAGNLFALFGHVLRTPPLKTGVLDGTIRRWLLQHASAFGYSAQEAPLTAAELARADCVFLSNSVRLLQPLHSLDGVRLRVGDLGRVMQVLLKDIVGG